MGDLNLNRLKFDERDGKPLRDIEDICLITESTRVTITSQTLLDVILTNKPEMFNKTGVADLGSSDHFMIYGFLNEPVIQHAAKVIIFRSIKNVNIEDFKRDLNETKWFLEDQMATVDDQYNHMYGKYDQSNGQTHASKENEGTRTRCTLHNS